MVGRHHYGGAIGHHGLDLPPERSACRTVYSRKGLIQQEQIRMPHPGAGEQYTTELSIRHLPQCSLGEIGQPEKGERPAGGRPIRRGRRVVQADARMPP